VDCINLLSMDIVILHGLMYFNILYSETKIARPNEARSGEKK